MYSFKYNQQGTTYMPSMLAATASGSSKHAWHIPDAVCIVLGLLMMGGETA